MRQLPIVSCALTACVVLMAFAAFEPQPASAAEISAPLTDIVTGLPLLYASYVTQYDGMLYFRGSIDTSGTNTSIWRSDGLAAEAVPGTTSPNGASYLSAHGGKLYYAYSLSGAPRLWQYDPVGGAQQAPGSSANLQNPEEMASYSGKLYFRATRYGSPGNIGTELWTFDGTNQTPIDLFPGIGSSNPQHFIQYDGQLYFNACGTPGQGTELWRTNGVGMPTLAAQIYPDHGSSPEQFAVFNNQLYFSAYDGVHGRELWRFDGTGAAPAADIFPGVGFTSSNPNNLAAYNNKLYFSATDAIHGYELWSFDGTTAQMVPEINPTPDPLNGDTFLMDSSPADLTVFNGLLYFSADDGVHGRELWSYDGTSVSMVEDLNPGQYGSSPTELTVYGGKLYFSADDGYNPGVRALMPSVFVLTPEPATLALLAAGALGLLRRRRG